MQDFSDPPPALPGASAAGSANAPGWERSVLEKLALETLTERKRERRWKYFWRFSVLGFLLLLFAMAWRTGASTAAPSLPHTALIDVKGEIAADSEASAEALIDALRAAFEDDGSKGIILRVNSPGGSPVQSGIVNDEIRRLKEKHKKPIYAVVEESCASGAYYIAVAADQIYVNKASIVGSVGVLMDGFGFTGLMEKAGVERRLITAGENKGLLDPFSPMSAKHKEYAQAMIDQIHQQFIKVVKEGRGKRLKETPETFSGLFWNGEQAVALGLADGLGTVDSVARDVIKAEELIDYTRRENVAERLAKRFGASMGEGAVKALRYTNALPR
jgi:protease-4